MAISLGNLPSYHPDDFTHGLLALHCYFQSEEGQVVERIIRRVNRKTNKHELDDFLKDLFSEEDSNLEDLDKITKIEQNLKKWSVNRIFFDKKYEYCGVLYKNEDSQQLVLAHKGTQRWGSTIEDMMRVVGKTNTSFNLEFRKAIEESIEHAKRNEHALSFTGHSLGGWLAQLSVYYSHQMFNYRNVKCVTFDAPGARIMIEQRLQRNCVQGPHLSFKLEQLDMISYLSLPNLINCFNLHIGQVYFLDNFADNKKETSESAKWILRSFGFVRTIEGHGLLQMLSKFNHETGKPIKIQKILRWPKLTMAISHHGNARVKGLRNWLIKKVFQSITKVVTVAKVTREYRKISKSLFSTIKEEKYPGIVKINETEITILPPDDFDMRNKQDAIDNLIVELLNRQLHSFEEDELLKKTSDFIKNKCKYDTVNMELSVTNKNLQMNDIRDRARRIYHKYPKSGDIKFIDNTRSLIRARKSIKLVNKFLNLDSRTRLIKDNSALSKIDDLFKENKIIFIVGLPGIGKSTLARQYSDLFLKKDDQNNIVLSFRMDSVNSIRETYFESLIDALFEGEKAKILQNNLNQEQIEKVNKQINTKLTSMDNKFLFVFDDFLKDNLNETSDGTENITSIKLLELILTNMNNSLPVQILITTKHSEDNFSGIDNANFFHPEMFDNEKAREFFKINMTERKIEESDIYYILEKLNSKEHLPYKLWLVLMNIKENIYSIDQLLENHFIASNFSNVLFTSLLQRNDHMIDVLQAFAFTDPNEIRFEFLTDVIGLEKETTENSINKLISMHYLNADIDRDDDVYYIFSNTLILDLNDFFRERQNENPVLNLVIDKYLTNIKKFAERNPKWSKKLTRTIWNFFSKIHGKTDGNYEEKIVLIGAISTNCSENMLYFEKLEINKILLKIVEDKRDNSSLARALFNLGNAYYKLNKFESARDDYLKSLEMMNENVAGQTFHQSIVETMNKLGSIYDNLNEHEKAIEYYKKSLEVHQNILGNIDDPFIANTLDNLGNVYTSLDKYQQAIGFYQKSLEMKENLFDKSAHPSIADTLNSLGNVYIRLNRYNEAIGYYKRSLQMKETLFGKRDHPSIADTLHCLGIVHAKFV